jgi:hypothetical protein
MTNEKHDKGLIEIVKNLSLFGIENDVFIAKEPQLYNANGRLIGEPDVVVIDNTGEWHKFEYKCTCNKTDRAIHQLQRDSDFIHRNFGKTCNDYYVYGDLIFKKLR